MSAALACNKPLSPNAVQANSLDEKANPPMTQEALVQLGKTYLYPNYRQPDLVMVRGEGRHVWDAKDKKYLDFTAGIAVNTLGHGHPGLTKAICEQSKRLMHTSNYFFTEPNVRLAQKLCDATGMARAFFCNSGTEAIEACLKLARRHFFDKGETSRQRVIAFEKAFHGRSLGALAATWSSAYREGFGTLSEVSHVPYGDLDAVRQAMSPDVAAILFEPVQGEGGVVPGSVEFLQGLRAVTQEHGALLIADEIQAGVGRTGRFLAVEHSGVKPDLVALAKGLGGGFPIGAMVCTKALERSLPAGSHGTTYGGNPLASAAALAVLAALDNENLVKLAATRGKYLTKRLNALKQQLPEAIEGVRGVGLMVGIALNAKIDTREVLGELRTAGLLLTLASGVLRVVPPLNVTESEIDEAVAILGSVLSDK